MEAKPPKAYLQFKLRHLFLMMGTAAVIFWMISDEVIKYRAKQIIEDQGGKVRYGKVTAVTFLYDSPIQAQRQASLAWALAKISDPLHLECHHSSTANTIGLSELPNLKYLEVHATTPWQSEVFQIDQLKALNKLEGLELHLYRVDAEVFETLATLPRLKSLTLVSEKTETFQGIKELTALRALALETNYYPDGTWTALGRLSDLESLTMLPKGIIGRWAPVDDFAEIENLQNLEAISVRLLPIDDSHLQHFEALARLTSLRLERTNCTQGELERVRQNLSWRVATIP